MKHSLLVHKIIEENAKVSDLITPQNFWILNPLILLNHIIKKTRAIPFLMSNFKERIIWKYMLH